MKQPCYQACARKTDKVTFTTRSDPIVFAIVFNGGEPHEVRPMVWPDRRSLRGAKSLEA